jgi:hypothetical protein
MLAYGQTAAEEFSFVVMTKALAGAAAHCLYHPPGRALGGGHRAKL